VRYALDPTHTAMIDPPADVSVLGADVAGAALGDCETGAVADGEADGDASAESGPDASGTDGDICARALLTWSPLSVRTGAALMP